MSIYSLDSQAQEIYPNGKLGHGDCKDIKRLGDKIDLEGIWDISKWNVHHVPSTAMVRSNDGEDLTYNGLLMT